MASVRLKPLSKYWWACITVTLPDGSRKQRQFSTGLEDKAAALQAAVTAENAAKRAKPDQLRAALNRLADDLTESKAVDPAQWLEGWALRKSREVDDKSAKKYAGVARDAAAWMRSQSLASMAALTPDNLRDLRNHWLSEHAESTAKGKMKILRMALLDAWRDGIIAEQIGKKVAGGKGEGTKVKRREFRAGELEMLLRVASPKWRVFSLLGLYTAGQRFGDIATMRGHQINLITDVVSFLTEKTGLVLHLPIVTSLREALLAYELPDDPNAFLFPDLAAMGSAARSNAFRDEVLVPVGLATSSKERAPAGNGKRRRTSELSFHSFRHTATTLLKAAGVSDSIAMAIVGHESEAVSRNYTHIDLATMRAAMEKLPVVGQP